MVVLLDEKGESVFDFEFNANSYRDRLIHEMTGMLDANDIDRLREAVLCTSDRLLDNSIRSRAWPLFIGQDPNLDVYMKSILDKDTTEEACHKDTDQVMKDVDRSFIYLSDTAAQHSDIEFLRKRLFKIIMNVLKAIPGINYYQGYHDVATLVVLTFEDDYEAFQFLYILTLRYLRDHMMTSIRPTMKQLDIIPELISHIDYDLYLILKQSQPVYALSSIISLFTHDITNIADISLIWDFIFACDDPQLIIYIYTALLIYYKDDIIIDLNEMSDSSIDSVGSRYDVDIVHAVLNTFIRTHLSIDSIDSKLEVYNVLKLALDLKRKIPLTKLKSFKQISKFSFLKSKSTSITVLALQIKEHQRYESQLKKKRLMNKKLNNSELLKRELRRSPMILRASLGVCILGVILHTTYKNSGIKIGIGNELARNVTALWNCMKDTLK